MLKNGCLTVRDQPSYHSDKRLIHRRQARREDAPDAECSDHGPRHRAFDRILSGPRKIGFDHAVRLYFGRLGRCGRPLLMAGRSNLMAA